MRPGGGQREWARCAPGRFFAVRPFGRAHALAVSRPARRSRCCCCVIGNRTSACVPVMKMRPWRSVYLSSGLTVAQRAARSTQHGGASCFDLVRTLTNVVQTLVYLPVYVGTCLAICSLV